jgi:hypothetical protein
MFSRRAAANFSGRLSTALVCTIGFPNADDRDRLIGSNSDYRAWLVSRRISKHGL